MRASVTSLSSKLFSIFVAATLSLGLMPITAFATSDSLQSIPEGPEGVASIASSAEGGDDDVFSHCPSNEASSADGGGAATSSENVADNDGPAVMPAGEILNQTMPLTMVAQQESARSYFLAQTLESTRTVPIVSASLPLDAGSNSDASSIGDDGDEVLNVIAAESTVVGSFPYLGMTFAIEPGGESVALVATDYSQLPEQFIEKQVLVIPDAVTPDGIDYYSVTRIADGAFASLTKENANPDYKGCEALFADEELLAEAGIDASEVEAFLNPESDMVDIDGDGEMDTPANPLKDCTGILAMGVPASVASIGDEAFAGFDTLQYLVVSEDDPNYATFDGVLYDADLANLRLIPEGRVGAVRVAPSATDVDPEVFSHCPSVDILVADADSVAYAALTSGDVYPDLSRLQIEVLVGKEDSCGEIWNDYLFESNSLAPYDKAANFFIARKTADASLPGIPAGHSGVFANGGTFYSTFSNYTLGSTSHTGGNIWQVNNTTIKLYNSDYSYLIDTLTLNSRSNCTFLGWAKNSMSPTGLFKTGTFDKSAVTWLVAHWRVRLTWDPNGGWWGTDKNAKDVMASNNDNYTNVTSYDNATLPQRDGYTFKGWSTNESATNGETSIEVPNSPTKYYAVWEPEPYPVTLTWDTAGGSAIGDTIQMYDPASPTTVELPANDPTKNGYTLSKWVDANGTQVTSSTALPTSNTTYTAVWTGNPITLTWNSNGGNWSESTSDVITTQTFSDTAQVALCAQPAKDGYTFKGWYTSVTGDTQVTNATALPSADAVYYAQWDLLEYLITIDLGDPVKTPAMSGGNGDGVNSPSWSFDTDGAVHATYTVEMEKVTLPSFTLSGYEYTVSGPGIATPTSSFSFVPGTEGFAQDLEYSLSWTAPDLSVGFSGVEHVMKDDSPLPTSVGIELLDVIDGNAYVIGELTEFEEQGSYGIYDAKRYSVFVGWRIARADEAGKLVYLEGTNENPKKTLSITLDSFGEKSVLYVEPVFEMRAWTVVFEQDGKDVASATTAFESDEPMVAPIPVTRGRGDVFAYWGVASDSEGGWRADEALTIEDIFAAGYPDSAIEGDTVRLHTVWIPCVSAELPLYVTIAFDTETADTKAGEGRLSTSYDGEVKVLSLVYDKAETSLLGGGTDHVLGDAPKKATLRIMPISSDAQGDDDELFGAVTPVDVNLGTEDVFTGGELNAFPSFGKDGSYLRIRYDIAFEKDFDLTKLRLPVNDGNGPHGTSSQTFPIAKLYYTVGLA